MNTDTLALDEAERAELSAKRMEQAEQFMCRGVDFLAQHDTKSALQAFKEAVKRNPTKARYRAMLAATYQKQGMSAYAQAEMREALKLDPKDRLALKLQAQLQALNLTQGPSKTRSRKKDTPKHTSFRRKKRSLLAIILGLFQR